MIVRVVTLAMVVLAGCTPHARADPPEKQARRSPMRACDASSECTIVARGCCNTCGEPTRTDVMAVNAEYAASHPRRECEGVACGRCYAPPGPSLVPICSSGRCNVLDVARSSLSRCRTAEECVAREPSCCGSCGSVDPERLIALHRDRQDGFSRLVCGATMTCPACATDIPDVPLDCVSGHCRRLRSQPR